MARTPAFVLAVMLLAVPALAFKKGGAVPVPVPVPIGGSAFSFGTRSARGSACGFGRPAVSGCPFTVMSAI